MSDNPNTPGRGTLAVHAGVEPDPTTGAIMTPVYLTSTYVQDGVGNHKGFEYSRTHNPTRSALQDAFAALGTAARFIASGLAARHLASWRDGDQLNDLYGGSTACSAVFAHYGIRPVVWRPRGCNCWRRRVWIETPTTPDAIWTSPRSPTW